ncbi:hypothetical protein Nans01_09620 [Nocardiopsis ansamitocini]|uniref:Uncharacterized protein n=1 Tax=Nocardiopsis ansamitocini TaxID=1670832 RepID=A0A9W6P3V8_9ACTN|nr:hypothetical protein Nans01_09620 [Nocardiopsis ansamitocini]
MWTAASDWLTPNPATVTASASTPGGRRCGSWARSPATAEPTTKGRRADSHRRTRQVCAPGPGRVRTLRQMSGWASGPGTVFLAVREDDRKVSSRARGGTQED